MMQHARLRYSQVSPCFLAAISPARSHSSTTVREQSTKVKRRTLLATVAAIRGTSSAARVFLNSAQGGGGLLAELNISSVAALRTSYRSFTTSSLGANDQVTGRDRWWFCKHCLSRNEKGHEACASCGVAAATSSERGLSSSSPLSSTEYNKSNNALASFPRGDIKSRNSDEMTEEQEEEGAGTHGERNRYSDSRAKKYGAPSPFTGKKETFSRSTSAGYGHHAGLGEHKTESNKGARRHVGGTNGLPQGSWSCVECGFSNFPARQICLQCGGTPAHAMGGRKGGTHHPRHFQKDHDFTRTRGQRDNSTSRAQRQQQHSEENANGVSDSAHVGRVPDIGRQHAQGHSAGSSFKMDKQTLRPTDSQFDPDKVTADYSLSTHTSTPSQGSSSFSSREFLSQNVRPLAHLAGCHKELQSYESKCVHIIPQVSMGFFGRDARLRRLIIRLTNANEECGSEGMDVFVEHTTGGTPHLTSLWGVNDSSSSNTIKGSNPFRVPLGVDPRHAYPATRGWDPILTKTSVDQEGEEREDLKGPAPNGDHFNEDKRHYAGAHEDACGAACSPAESVLLPPRRIRNSRLQSGDWGCGSCGFFNKASWPICAGCNNNRYKTHLIYASSSSALSASKSGSGQTKIETEIVTPNISGGHRQDLHQQFGGVGSERPHNYGVPNISFIGVVGLDDQLRLRRMQEVYFEAYYRACAGPLEDFIKKESPLVNPLGGNSSNEVSIVNYSKTTRGTGAHSNSMATAKLNVVEPEVFKALSLPEKVDVLFTEPAWFCPHCGFLSKPSRRLTSKLQESLRTGQVSIYHPFVVSGALKYRATCDHCLTNRVTLGAPYAHPVLKNRPASAASLYPEHTFLRTIEEMRECDRFFREHSENENCNFKMHSAGENAANNTISPNRAHIGGAEGKKMPAVDRFDRSKGRFLSKDRRPIEASGDWICKCGCLNYRLRRVCSSCGLGRLLGLASLRLDTGSENYGDWLCSCCLVWNLRFVEHCFNCHWRSGSGNAPTLTKEKDNSGNDADSKLHADKLRWTTETAISLGVRYDPYVYELAEVNRHNSSILEKLSATTTEASREDNPNKTGEPQNVDVAGHTREKGNTRTLNSECNMALTAAQTARKFTSGHISNALFIVGEDVLPDTVDAKLRTLVGGSEEPRVKKRREANGSRPPARFDPPQTDRRESDITPQNSHSHDGDTRGISDEWRGESPLWEMPDSSPKVVAHEYSRRRHMEQNSEVTDGKEADQSSKASSLVGPVVSVLNRQIKQLYPKDLKMLGVCTACGHRNRYDQFGPGSTCVKCHTVLFPMIFPRWEKIESDAQKIVFPSTNTKSKIPRGTVAIGLPKLSALVTELTSKQDFLMSTKPCTHCGVYNSEHRVRCRRCGHINEWTCQAEVPKEDARGNEIFDKKGNIITERCGAKNADERSYCHKCGTVRPAGVGHVVVGRREHMGGLRKAKPPV